MNSRELHAAPVHRCCSKTLSFAVTAPKHSAQFAELLEQWHFSYTFPTSSFYYNKIEALAQQISAGFDAEDPSAGFVGISKMLPLSNAFAFEAL